MKHVVVALYALLITAGVLYLEYTMQPIVVASPKWATFASIGLMVLSFLIAILLLYPQKALAYFLKANQVLAYYVYVLGVICSMVMPWVRGVSGFGVWEWVAVIMYMWGVSAVMFQLSQATYRTFAR